MLNWIKKRCRRKSAPSCGIQKFLSDSAHFPVNHVYEEIDDVNIPSSLAYAIVDIKGDNSEKSSEGMDCCACKGLNDTSRIRSTSEQSLTLTNQDYEEYEIPETVNDSPPSPIYENLPKPISNQNKFTDFSRRPLPDIPQIVNPKCHKSMTKLSSFGELSYSEESSNSSGYFDSSYMTDDSDSSSDDSFINEFEMMAIKRKEMVCRKNRRRSKLQEASKPEVASKQPSLPIRESNTLPKHKRVSDSSRLACTKVQELMQPQTFILVQGQLIYPQGQTRRIQGHVEPEVRSRHPLVEVSRSSMKPRMGCRALANSTMTRSRSASRVHDPQFSTVRCQSSFAVQRSLRVQRAEEVSSGNERAATSYLRSVSSPGLPFRSTLSPEVVKATYINYEDGLYEDVF